jgi:hypothetical protein
MSWKECAVLAAMILATSSPSYGNSIVGADQDPVILNAGSAVIGNRPASASNECVVFRSPLQDAPEGGTGIQDTDTRWKSSHAAAGASKPEGILFLPEPGTGAMLSIGLFAVILAGIRRTSHSYTRSAV